MPTAWEANLRHARHYAKVAAHANRVFVQGHDSQQMGLSLFDVEQLQIDACWVWLREAEPSGITDELLCTYVDGTSRFGRLRYHVLKDQIPRLQLALAAARRRHLADRELWFLASLGSA